MYPMEAYMKVKVYLSVIIILLLLFSYSVMANTGGDIPKTPVCYVTVEGTKQGKFKGESLNVKQSNKIEGLKYAFTLAPGGGIVAGKGQQGVVLITKVMGGASPQTFSAMITGEVLKTVTLEFVRGSLDGSAQIFHTVRLLNAKVTSIHQFSEGNTVYEEVIFTYQKIEMTNHIANTTASD
jgi:type VI secretion system secreted protein Hcp